MNPEKGAVSMDAAAAILGESVMNIKKMVFEGDLQGVLALDGKWWVLQESVEKILGREINIVLV